MNISEEIKKRRTFGIISHPDAGKTTLTEKLLLYGGAIQEAGAVKSNKIKKSATSDFMEIERQRGISVATSVLAFTYKNKKINILDEVEKKLGLNVTPLSIPIGMGYDFRGIYNIWKQNVKLFKDEKKQIIGEKKIFYSIEDPVFKNIIGDEKHKTLIEELELIQGVYPHFNKQKFLESKIQPVFFGSALNNFGIEELLDCFIEIAPEPLPKFTNERTVKP